MKPTSRREFLKLLALGSGGALLAACSSQPAQPAPSAPTQAAPTAASQPSKPASTAAPTQAATPTRGGTLTVGAFAAIGTLDPHLMGGVAEREVGMAVFDTFFDVDKKGNIIPQLVESKEQPDATTLILHLRKGVKFHDGTDFNADVAKWNLERVLNPDTKSPRRSELSAIKEIQVVDPATIKLLLKTPAGGLLGAMTDRGTMMCSPTAIQKYGADFTRHPVGTGPFQFVEWVPGDHVTIKRFDGYWQQGLPYLDQIVFRELVDDGVRASALRAGTIDTMDMLAPKDVATMKAVKGISISEAPGQRIVRLEFNVKKPPFDNKALRQAVAWAIDKDAILKNVYFGIGAVGGNAAVTPAGWAYDSSLTPYYPRDVNKAKQKLAEGGKPGGFSFSMMTSYPDLASAGEIIQANLREIGVNMDIQRVDTPTELARSNAGDYEGHGSIWGSRLDPDIDVPAIFGTGGSNNQTGYSNPKVDDLLTRARASLSQDERLSLYKQMQQVLSDDAPIIALVYLSDIRGVGSRPRDYGQVADGKVRYTRVWVQQ